MESARLRKGVPDPDFRILNLENFFLINRKKLVIASKTRHKLIKQRPTTANGEYRMWLVLQSLACGRPCQSRHSVLISKPASGLDSTVSLCENNYLKYRVGGRRTEVNNSD